MATTAQISEPAARVRLAWAARRLQTPVAQLILALLAYLAVDLGYFGIPVLPHFGRTCACGAGSDPFTYMWFLAWWPHALFHGHNPFVTTALFAPDRISLGAVDLVPGAALLLAPVTLLFGPLAAYNVAALAAPLLAAVFAFLLCRYVTRHFAASLVGGYIYGFSPYMLGHMQGHLDLVLIFPIPAAVHLTLRRMDGRISRSRFVILLALLLGFFFLCSQELTVTFVLLGALALLVSYALAPSVRERIRQTVPLILLSGAIAAALAGVFIYYALTGEVLSSFFNRYSDTVVADTLGFLVPTNAEVVGHAWFSSLSAKFVGGIPENGVYVGLPFVIVTALYLATRWRRAATRILVSLLAVIVVLMLGSHLHVAGSDRFHIGSHHTIPLPWYALSRLPYLHEIAPARLGVYMFLIIALIAAMWLASPRRGWAGAAKWAVAALGIAAMVPNIGNGGWRSTPENPRLFTTTAYRSVIGRGETVVGLPFAYFGDSMLWQAETGFRFRLAEGYLGALLPADYARDVQSVPSFSNPPAAPDGSVVKAFAARRGVRLVVLDPASAPTWPPALAAAGLKPRAVGGTLIYEVPRR